MPASRIRVVALPALLVANKSDLGDATADLAVLRELTSLDMPAVAVSTAVEGQALETIAPWLFDKLGIVRVYTKTPGKPAEMDKPFTVRRGATVLDVARLVHKDIARALKYARAWGTEVYAGQQVGPEHAVADRDVLELHMR